MRTLRRILCALGAHRLGMPLDSSRYLLLYRCCDCSRVYGVPTLGDDP